LLTVNFLKTLTIQYKNKCFDKKNTKSLNLQEIEQNKNVSGRTYNKPTTRTLIIDKLAIEINAITITKGKLWNVNNSFIM